MAAFEREIGEAAALPVAPVLEVLYWLGMYGERGIERPHREVRIELPSRAAAHADYLVAHAAQSRAPPLGILRLSAHGALPKEAFHPLGHAFTRKRTPLAPRVLDLILFQCRLYDFFEEAIGVSGHLSLSEDARFEGPRPSTGRLCPAGSREVVAALSNEDEGNGQFLGQSRHPRPEGQRGPIPRAVALRDPRAG